MKHHLSHRVRPQLEALEDRCTPSTFSSLLEGAAVAPSAPVSAAGIQVMPAAADQLPAAPAASQTNSQVVPFEVFGRGTAPQGLPLFTGGMVSHTSAGFATLVGHYTGEGMFTNLGFTSPTTGDFQGTFNFTARNGDVLACTYGAGGNGRFTVVPVGQGKVIVDFLAEFNPIPAECTGRFANITGGGWTMVAQTDPFDPTPNAQGFTEPFGYEWAGLGFLTRSESPGADNGSVADNSRSDILAGRREAVDALLGGMDTSLRAPSGMNQPTIPDPAIGAAAAVVNSTAQSAPAQIQSPAGGAQDQPVDTLADALNGRLWSDE
jgi:hypothetical protein